MIRRLLLLATLPALAACGDAADESDNPMAGAEAIAPVSTNEATEQASAGPDPAATGVAAPDAAATDTANTVNPDRPEEMGEQYQDFVGEQPPPTE